MQFKGFTLIELLVVIAIMGILASMVLLRYPIAIKKVRDSRIMSALNQFRTRAGIMYQSANDFSEMDCLMTAGQCQCSDNSLLLLCQDADRNSDQDLIIHKSQDQKSFCILGHLQDYQEWFCIDGNLLAKRYVASPATCDNPCETQVAACTCE